MPFYVYRDSITVYLKWSYDFQKINFYFLTHTMPTKSYTNRLIEISKKLHRKEYVTHVEKITARFITGRITRLEALIELRKRFLADSNATLYRNVANLLRDDCIEDRRKYGNNRKK